MTEEGVGGDKGGEAKKKEYTAEEKARMTKRIRAMQE